MATTESLQSLHDEFRKLMDHTKVTQGSLQHLRSAKKDADVKKRQQDVVSSLKIMHAYMDKLQKQIEEEEANLEEAMGGQDKTQEERKPKSQQSQEKKETKGIGMVETRNLNPEQQEALYELKATRMGAMQSQNKVLKRELLLNRKKKQLLEARYIKTQSYSGSETLRAAHALEAKLRGANLKIRGLEDELRKSQQMALRYRELYEDSERQTEADHASKDKQQNRSAPKHTPIWKSEPSPKLAPQKEQSFLGPTTSVNDVIRKTECLLEENEVQKREIQRLKRDNAELILLAKSASSDRDSILARLGTSEAARQDLQKRHNKLKNEHGQLSRSYTRQASEWIDIKKQQQHYESQGRWGEIYPVAPHGSKERFFEHGQRENTSQPRQMYPVESYGGTSTA